jgi:DNA modification methylase
MTVSLLRGDALHLPIADHTVDLVVTSPPYFGLRSYQDGGQHYPGQIGSEATPAEWVAAMLAATAEMVRVLKPCGSIWVNLGDKYAGNHGTDRSRMKGLSEHWSTVLHAPNVQDGARSKSLLGLPWRYALACIDTTRHGYLHTDAVRRVIDDLAAGEIDRNTAHRRIDDLEAEAAKGSPGLGLILRAEVIWSKPNGLPESVTDRVRRSHETWLHFTTQPRYFSAVDEIREAHVYPDDTRHLRGGRRSINPDGTNAGGNTSNGNPLGKLPGSVWTVPSQPLTVPAELGVDHFAAFPMAWPRRLIGGWSPAGICTVCGDGRRPVADRKPMQWRQSPTFDGRNANGRSYQPASGTMLAAAETTITGYACGCPDTTAPTTPAIVLDGFGGTGTTALVAHVMGRHGITVDLSADYCRLAAWRTTDPGQLALAAQVEKPPAQTTGQATLFEVTG